MMAHKARPVILSLILAFGMAGYYFHIFLPRARATRAAHQIGFVYGEDFYPYWFGTRELLTGHVSPYSQEATGKIQTALYGRTLDPRNPYERDQHRFSYPLYVVLLLAPFAAFRFEAVRIGAALVFPVFVVVGISFLNRALRLELSCTKLAMVVILTLSTYPLLDALVTQQLTLLVFFAVSAAAYFLTRQQLWPAGAALAISTIKPQLVLCPILFLLIWSANRWKERKKLALAFSLSLAVLAGASILLLPTWPMEWLNTIRSYRQYTVPPLAPYILGHSMGTVLIVFLLAITAWFSWTAREDEAGSERFALTLAFVLAVSVVTIPMGNAVYDHLFILPGVLLLLSRWRILLRGATARGLLWICTAIFLWQWISGTAVFLVELVSPKIIRFPIVLSAPLRTQPSMPFAVLALLGLGIVHSMRSKHRLIW